MMALGNINPSLVQYTGGWGKAAQALGGSMAQVGQARMELEQKKKDNEYRSAVFDISKNADNRAETLASDTKQKAITDEANKLEGARVYAQKLGLSLGEPMELGKTDPEKWSQNNSALLGLGVEGLKNMAPEKKKYKSTDAGFIFNETDPTDFIDNRVEKPSAPHTQQLANGNIGIWNPKTNKYDDTGQAGYKAPVQPKETPEWKVKSEWIANHGDIVKTDSPYWTNKALHKHIIKNPYTVEYQFKKHMVSENFGSSPVSL